MITGNERKPECDWKNIRIRITKVDKEKERTGKEAEIKTTEYLKSVFSKFPLIKDIYFEINYNQDIQMYRTMQIDHILFGKKAIYVIETKSLPNNVKLTGGSKTQKWIYYENDNHGRKRTHGLTNADNQNQKHKEYIQNMIKSKLGIDIPVISIVNIIGIDDENISLNLMYKHEVVAFRELGAKISYYEKFLSKEYSEQVVNDIHNSISIERVYNGIIPEIQDIGLKHLVYVKQVSKYIKVNKRKRKRKK